MLNRINNELSNKSFPLPNAHSHTGLIDIHIIKHEITVLSNEKIIQFDGFIKVIMNKISSGYYVLYIDMKIHPHTKLINTFIAKNNDKIIIHLSIS